MYVRCVDTIEELQPFREAWDALANGNPFRSFTWQTTWWRHYGGGQHELHVWLAFREQPSGQGSLAGVLPAYAKTSWAQGRVLRLLGDGEVCSDHVGLLASPEHQDSVAASIAASIAARSDWDLIDFAAIDADDSASQALADGLTLHDCALSRLIGEQYWAIDLPPTWEDFLAMQSKSHRKQLRQMTVRVIESDRAAWKLVESPSDFATAWATLVDLHQRRRQSLGEPGCFASPCWAAFHWDVAQQLLRQGKLRLSTLQLDGKAIAAEYHIAGHRTTYAYQGGVDPDRLHDEPGQLSTVWSIRGAIENGHTQFDFLRGDEPYKAHWRATPRATTRIVAIPARLWPKLRRGAWEGVRDAARAAKQLAGFTR